MSAKTGEVLSDFVRVAQEEIIARGGRGGRGNAAFVTSVNQAPRKSEPGEPGEERALLLELKVLADVGLVGLPNAGKSTLISALSAARPKIAEYPFTTLSPHLGVVEVADFKQVVVADIPGLIRGAHEGTGLGHYFLRHVERCRLLLHLVDVSQLGEEDPRKAFDTINQELRLYKRSLAEKPQLIVASKMDVVDPNRLAILEEYCRIAEQRLILVSAATATGLDELRLALHSFFDSEGS
jgi:GTP-binding protein